MLAENVNALRMRVGFYTEVQSLWSTTHLHITIRLSRVTIWLFQVLYSAVVQPTNTSISTQMFRQMNTQTKVEINKSLFMKSKETSTNGNSASTSRRRFITGAGALATSTLVGALPTITQAQALGYQVLDTPIPTKDPSRIEVVEFFWFGCPHCFRLEPTINRWKESKPEDIDFRREAPPLNPAWENHSRTFYAAEALGITDKMIDQTFIAIHEGGNRLRSPKSAGALIEDLDIGVSAEEFMKAMQSFSVATSLNRSKKLASDSRISGVPAILINGKYITSASLAGGNEGIINVIDQLIEVERKSS